MMPSTPRPFRAARLLAFAALALAAAQPAAASTATTTFSVTATVAAACAINAATLAFGTYTGALASGMSSITATCTNTTLYDVGLSSGFGSGATASNRKMTGPSAAVLNYALYRDAAYTANWGETVGIDTLSGTGNGAAQSLSVYGHIPAGQLVTPGAYSDTVTATITF